MTNEKVIKELIDALDECLADIEVRSYFEDEEDWKETIAFLNKHRDTLNHAKASAALFTVAASESNTGLHAAVKNLREKLKQEANYLQLKDWHKLSFFERQTVKKLENLGFLEKKAFPNGFVGRSI